MSSIVKSGKRSFVSSPHSTPTPSKVQCSKKGTVKSATAEETDSQCKVLSVTPISPLFVVSTSHREFSKCPCDQSKSSWKIDCSKCKQFWHVNCLGLNGLNEKGYNKLAEYLCPFCYVAPIPTLPSEVDVCLLLLDGGWTTRSSVDGNKSLSLPKSICSQEVVSSCLGKDLSAWRRNLRY